MIARAMVLAVSVALAGCGASQGQAMTAADVRAAACRAGRTACAVVAAACPAGE